MDLPLALVALLTAFTLAADAEAAADLARLFEAPAPASAPEG